MQKLACFCMEQHAPAHSTRLILHTQDRLSLSLLKEFGTGSDWHPLTQLIAILLQSKNPDSRLRCCFRLDTIVFPRPTKLTTCTATAKAIDVKANQQALDGAPTLPVGLMAAAKKE